MALYIMKKREIINYNDISAIYLFRSHRRVAKSFIIITRKEACRIKIEAVPGIAVARKEHLLRVFYEQLKTKFVTNDSSNLKRCDEKDALLPSIFY